MIQAWDFRPGENFVLQMHSATIRAERTVAVLSPAYLAATYTQPEWAAVLVDDPTGTQAKLVPVRVAEVEPQGMLKAVVYIDLVGLDDEAMRSRLLDGIRTGRGKPAQPPAVPRTAEVAARAQRAPASTRHVTNVPPVSPHFVVRTDAITAIRAATTAAATPGKTTLPVALHGAPGVGKTQLASWVAGDATATHDVVWWVRSQREPVLVEDYAALGRALGLTANSTTGTAGSVDATKDWLVRSSGWLLIFDGLPSLDGIRDLVPVAGQGTVLVTTRQGAGLRGSATAIAVGPLTGDEASTFLVRRTGDPDQDAARLLARDLDYLPLALEQAAAYIDEHALRLCDYRERLAHAPAALLERGTPAGYPTTLAATWRLAIQEVAKADPSAVDLVHVLAFVDNERFPVDVLARAGLAPDELALDDLIGLLLRHSLIERRADGIHTHQSFQDITRYDLTDKEQRTWAAVALKAVAASLPPDAETPASRPTMAAMLPHVLAVTRHTERLQVEPETTSQTLVKAALYLRSTSQLVPARDLFSRALAQPESNELGRASMLGAYGSTLWRLGAFDDAQRAYQESLDLRRRLRGLGHRDVADSLDDLGTVLQRRARYQQAADLHQQALDIRRSSGGADAETWVSLNNLGLAQWRLGRLADAATTLVAAQTALDDAKAAAPIERAVVISNIGSVAASRDDQEAALTNHDTALAALLSALGDANTKVAVALCNKGASLYATGGPDGDARAALEQSLTLVERFYGPDNPAVALVVNNLGVVYHGQGDLVLSRAAHERSLAIRRRAFGPDHPTVSVALGNLALVEADEGRLDAAANHLREALALAQRSLGPTHRDVGELLVDTGWTEWLRHDNPAATDAWRQALPILGAVYHSDDPRLAQLRLLADGTLPTERAGRAGQDRYGALFMTS